MSTINFSPCSHSEHLSKDIEYRRLFSEPLTKPGGTLSYEGYLRAIQLYGREDLLVNSHKVHRYDRWVKSNPELHRSYQDQARRDGYNPTGGSSNAFTGIHYPNPPLGGPSLQLTHADTDPNNISPYTPERQVTTAQSNTMPPRRSRDSSGRFAASEDAFAFHKGNIKAKPGQDAGMRLAPRKMPSSWPSWSRLSLPPVLPSTNTKRPGLSSHPWGTSKD